MFAMGRVGRGRGRPSVGRDSNFGPTRLRLGFLVTRPERLPYGLSGQ